MPPDAFVEWELPLDFSLPRDDLDGMSLQELADVPFEELGRFKQAQSFPHGYSTVHPVIMHPSTDVNTPHWSADQSQTPPAPPDQTRGAHGRGMRVLPATLKCASE